MLAHRLGMVPLVSREAFRGMRYTRVRYVWRVSLPVLTIKDCDCEEGCYYCMITLRLKVSNPNGEKHKAFAVTSNMLEVVPSPNAPPPANPYGPTPLLSGDDQAIVDSRDPELGQPVGKGDPSVPPVLLAKMSRGQEIELTCKAYKVSTLDRLRPATTSQSRYPARICLTRRELPNTMRSGHHCPLLGLNTTPTTSFAIPHIGMKPTVRIKPIGCTCSRIRKGRMASICQRRLRTTTRPGRTF